MDDFDLWEREVRGHDAGFEKRCWPKHYGCAHDPEDRSSGWGWVDCARCKMEQDPLSERMLCAHPLGRDHPQYGKPGYGETWNSTPGFYCPSCDTSYDLETGRHIGTGYCLQ